MPNLNMQKKAQDDKPGSVFNDPELPKSLEVTIPLVFKLP